MVRHGVHPIHVHVPILPLTLDDGSGSVTILESYRALIAADFRPVRTIEFHWYSAEVRPVFIRTFPVYLSD